MNNRPEEIRYMITWGALSGGLLASVYSLIILGSNVPGYLGNIFFIFLISLIAFTQGGVLGVVLGLIDGLLLKYFMRDVSPRFAKEDIKSKRKWVYATIFAVPILIQLMFFLPAYIQNGFDFSALTLPDTYLRDIAMPLMIAAIAATYASHHYMVKLQEWSESLDARKSKAEDVSIQRLVEQAEQDEIYLPEIDLLEREAKR